jgi:hypothetical protein
MFSGSFVISLPSLPIEVACQPGFTDASSLAFQQTLSFSLSLSARPPFVNLLHHQESTPHPLAPVQTRCIGSPV